MSFMLSVPCDIKSPSRLPPTPSTVSSTSSINQDTKHKSTKERSYGSLNMSAPIISESPRTTISPNENDQGLYLLWTQELMKERGIHSDDSSVSEASFSSDEQPYQDHDYTVEQRNLISHLQDDAEEETGFFRSCFSACF